VVNIVANRKTLMVVFLKLRLRQGYQLLRLYTALFWNYWEYDKEKMR
jgi:hypothetical protein